MLVVTAVISTSIPGHRPCGSEQSEPHHHAIISRGTFNSPQLLLLGKISAEEHLEEFNITGIYDLPGVGRHLMDNQEMSIVVCIV